MATNKVLENLAHMKFMIRANTKVEDVVLKERKVDEEHWRLDVPDLIETKSRFLRVSHSDCEGFNFGRYSFKNFNPSIDKLRRKFDSEEPGGAGNCIEEVVTEEEMAQRYSSLIDTLAGKLKKGKKAVKKRSSESPLSLKKCKFKKPQE